jgi:acyl-CoA thioester hydrolase
MGHMNVQFYFEKALQGCVVLWNKLGINEKPVELGNTYLSLARAHIRFLKEQKPGAPFFFQTGISSNWRYRSKTLFRNDRNDYTATLCCF